MKEYLHFPKLQYYSLQEFYPSAEMQLVFVYLFGFYDISTFVGHLMPNLFIYIYKQSNYFKQFSLA